MSFTSIEWTERVWNCLRGCSRVSPGCSRCYAERIAARDLPGMRSPTTGKPFAVMGSDGPHWTGKVELIESKLLEPLSWRKPCRCFVNSMSDLFHESVPDETIDRIFAVMALCPHVTFQVLTKRAGRMREYFADGRGHKIESQGWQIERRNRPIELASWPLPNVWLGVSVEDQQRADERIPHLLQTPAAVRFLSCEPLLGPIDLWTPRYALPGGGLGSAFAWGKGVSWVIIGGESGPGARPMDLRWVRNIVRDCKDSAACFVKQLGADPWEGGDGDYGPNAGNRLLLHDRKGGDMSEWSPDLRIREFPTPRHTAGAAEGAK